MRKSSEMEAKISGMQAQFNTRAKELSEHNNGLAIEKARGQENNGGDNRYDDPFYHDMTDYYAHHQKKHDSPTKRLVNQKDATHSMKLKDPTNKDK